MVLADLNILCPLQTAAVCYDSNLIRIEYHKRKFFCGKPIYWRFYKRMQRIPGIWYQIWPSESIFDAIFNLDPARPLSENRKFTVFVENKYKEEIAKTIRFYLANSSKHRILVLIRLEGWKGGYRPTTHHRKIPIELFLESLLIESIEFNTVYTII